MGGVKGRKQKAKLALRLKKFDATQNKHSGVRKPGSMKK